MFSVVLVAGVALHLATIPPVALNPKTMQITMIHIRLPCRFRLACPRSDLFRPIFLRDDFFAMSFSFLSGDSI